MLILNLGFGSLPFLASTPVPIAPGRFVIVGTVGDDGSPIILPRFDPVYLVAASLSVFRFEYRTFFVDVETLRVTMSFGQHLLCEALAVQKEDLAQIGLVILRRYFQGSSAQYDPFGREGDPSSGGIWNAFGACGH